MNPLQNLLNNDYNLRLCYCSSEALICGTPSQQQGLQRQWHVREVMWPMKCTFITISLCVSLVVNVASECGFTDSHYKALQQLQRDLGSQYFNVLAFPCNQFGQQEPDSNKEIESFARKTYGATFPMFSKIAVTGAGANAAFKYLTESTGEEPTWNFWKYLVAPNGKAVKAWDSTVTIQEIKPYITELLRKILLKQKNEL
uniref:Glutathione peroxidase n=1 Tax=Chelonoidis abingdonii TaxID=106734 RepID=A0A8C0QI32_CHEAB